jgi:hypothetical protein
MGISDIVVVKVYRVVNTYVMNIQMLFLSQVQKSLLTSFYCYLIHGVVASQEKTIYKKTSE